MSELGAASAIDKDIDQQSILFSLLSIKLAAASLQRDIEPLLAQPQYWVPHVNRNDYLGGWDVLPLRCEQRHHQAHQLLQSFDIAAGEAWLDLPVLANCPAINALLLQLRCSVKAVRLMRLQAGSSIQPHRDLGLSLLHGEARLHVPIFTSDSVSFLVGRRPLPMQAGELWYFNADEIHEVHNRGVFDRVHLVIDCDVNDWLRAEIVSGAVYA